MYSPGHMTKLEDITDRWQHNEHTTGSEMKEFASMVENIAAMRWRNHFNGCAKDWGSTRNVKDNVPLALLDYIKARKSIRTYSPRLCCSLEIPPLYSSLAYTLNEFRRQFPRVVSVLIARECGVQVLHEWQSKSYNIPQLVKSCEHYELHLSLCIMRRLASEHGIPLYSTHRYELLNECFIELVSKLHARRIRPTQVTLKSCMVSGGMVSRVMARRASMVYAASDILSVRAQTTIQYNQTYNGYNL